MRAVWRQRLLGETQLHWTVPETAIGSNGGEHFATRRHELSEGSASVGGPVLRSAAGCNHGCNQMSSAGGAVGRQGTPRDRAGA